MKTTPVCSIFAGLLTVWPVAMAQEGGGGRFDDEQHRPGDMWKMVDRNQDGSISREEFAGMPRLEKLAEDKRQALFERLDKDSDGLISRAELHQGKPGPEGQHPGMPRIAELDKNSDGEVSFEEFQAGPMFRRLDAEKQRRIFSRLDSNADGKITPRDKPPHRPIPESFEHPRPDGIEHPRPDGIERPRPDGIERPRPDGIERPRPDHPRPRGLIDHLDKDGDGAVSFDEFKSNPRMAELDDETVRKRYQMMDRNRDGKLDRNDIPARDGERPKGDGAQGAVAPDRAPNIE